MGRPLRARYANTTYSDGVQEMSDAEIANLITPTLLTYAVNNSNTVFETSLRFNATPAGAANSVTRGSMYDTNAGNIGTHPATQGTIATYTLYQSEKAQTFSGTRPVQYSGSGQIAEMSDADITTYIVSPTVQSMIAGGQAGYYLGTSAPGTGTWSAVSTPVNDTYYNASSALVTTTYTLWQRTDGSIGTVRPLTASASGLIEMTDAEINSLAVAVSEYIRTTGIGTYALQASAPAVGTWTSRGSFVDTTNTLSSVNYTGYFSGTYTGYYSGAYTGYFTGAYTGSYIHYYSGAYTGYYTSYYTGSYTGYYTSYYSGNYANTRTVNYAGNYLGYYVSYYTGYYTGTYVAGSYVGYFGGNPFHISGYYQSRSNYGRYYAPTGWVQYFIGPTLYTGYYTNTRAVGYAGYYTGYYANYYTGYYTGSYATSYTGAYVGSYATAYAGAYTGSYTTSYSGSYSGSYASFYTGTYTGYYTGAYVNYFAGMTVQTTTGTAATYTLWVRTA